MRVIAPILTYSAQAWIITENDEKILNTFEGKIPVRIVGDWRTCYNLCLERPPYLRGYEPKVLDGHIVRMKSFLFTNKDKLN